MAVKLGYFGWRGNVYECEVLHYVLREDVSPPRWYAAVRPSPNQRGWIQAPLGPNGAAAIPANVVRDSREEAEADITIGALRKFGQDSDVEQLTKPLCIGGK